MPKVNYITVQIGPNRVVEGFYTLEDGLLTMTDANGEPVIVIDAAGYHKRMERHLAADDNPRRIAAYLTRETRRMVLDEQVEGFNDPLNYPKGNVA